MSISEDCKVNFTVETFDDNVYIIKRIVGEYLSQTIVSRCCLAKLKQAVIEAEKELIKIEKVEAFKKAIDKE